MFKIFFIVFLLTILRIQVTFPQILNRPCLLNLLNRPVQETILEVPRNYAPQPYSPQILETIGGLPIAPIPSIPPNTPTTIITDCSPSVCKNLVNTLQLMIVCNLLQNTQGGSDLAVQLAAPIINEVISSPNLSCGCANPLYTNPIFPSFVPSPTVVSPNTYTNVINPNYINTPVINQNGLYYNL